MNQDEYFFFIRDDYSVNLLQYVKIKIKLSKY